MGATSLLYVTVDPPLVAADRDPHTPRMARVKRLFMMPPFPLSIRESEEKRSMGWLIGCDFPVQSGWRLTRSRARSTTLLSMRVVFAVLAFCASFARAQDYDILIRNGRIV